METHLNTYSSSTGFYGNHTWNFTSPSEDRRTLRQKADHITSGDWCSALLRFRGFKLTIFLILISFCKTPSTQNVHCLPTQLSEINFPTKRAVPSPPPLPPP